MQPEDEAEDVAEPVVGGTDGGGGDELADALLSAVGLAAQIAALYAEASDAQRRGVEPRRRMVLSLVAAWPDTPPAARPVGFSGGA